MQAHGKCTTKIKVNLPDGMLDKKLAHQIGADALVTMRMRVKKGLNVQDQQMPKYAPMTKAMRKRKGRQTAVRDLTFTGRMLGALHVEVRELGMGRWQILIRLADGRARLLGGKNQAVSPWFGFSRDDQRKIRVALEGLLQEAMQSKIDGKET